MTYRPNFIRHGLDEYVVFSGTTLVGRVCWNEDWGCFEFAPKEDTYFGPVFLSDLVTSMVELEARKRKRVCAKCGAREFKKSTYLDAAGDVDECYRCVECGEILQEAMVL